MSDQQSDPCWRPSRRCPTCGHLGTQHAYTSSGKRCIGENWGCRCSRRPVSLVIFGAVIPDAIKEQLARAR